jgi:hypothetical protein
MDPVRVVVERFRCRVEGVCGGRCFAFDIYTYMSMVVTHTCEVKGWNVCSEEIYRLYADSVMINAVVETGCYPYEFWLLSYATQKLMEKKCREYVEVGDDMHVYVFRDHFVLVGTEHHTAVVFSLDAGKNCRPSYTSYRIACDVLYLGRGKLPKDVENVLRHYMAFYDLYRFFEEGKQYG